MEVLELLKCSEDGVNWKPVDTQGRANWRRRVVCTFAAEEAEPGEEIRDALHAVHCAVHRASWIPAASCI